MPSASQNAAASAAARQQTRHGESSPYISIGREETLPPLSAAIEHPSAESQGREALGRLVKQRFTHEEQALEQAEPVLELANDASTRALLVDALRLKQPPQFAVSAVRAAAFTALKPYSKDLDVRHVALQEFQTNSTDEHACEAAYQVVKSENIAEHPALRELCRRVVTGAEQEIAQMKLSPGVKYALLMLKESPSREVEDKTIQRAIEACRRSGIAGEADKMIALLLALGSKRAIDTVCDIAEQRIRPRFDPSDSFDYDWETRPIFFGVIPAVVTISGGIALTSVHGWPWAAIGVLIPLLTGSIATLWPSLRNYFSGKDVPDDVAESAIRRLSQTLPNERAEKVVLKAMLDKSPSPHLKGELAKALGSAKSADVVAKLVKVLTTGASDAKLLAVQALSERGEPEVQAALQAARIDPDPKVSLAAARAVAQQR